MIRRILTCTPKGRHNLYANKADRNDHIEGFVNQYAMTSSSADDKTIVFTSESIESIPAGFRACETSKIMGPDEFIEVFEIAEPGKDFELYSEGHFKRKK
jgi:hypothetical protein